MGDMYTYVPLIPRAYQVNIHVMTWRVTAEVFKFRHKISSQIILLVSKALLNIHPLHVQEKSIYCPPTTAILEY